MPAYTITPVKQFKKSFQLSDTMPLLKWILQIFSLDSGESKLNKCEKRWYIFKCFVSTFIIGMIDCYALYWKCNNIFSTVNPSIVLTDVTQMTYDYGQYIVDLVVIYKYGRELSQEYFKNFECIDKILDMTHHKEIKSKILKLTVFLLFIWFLVSALDITSWYAGYGIMTPVVYSLAYVFLLIKFLTNLDMTVQILQIKCRLRAIGDLLQECYRAAEGLPLPASMKDDVNDVISNKNWFYSAGCTRAVEMRSRNHPLKNHFPNQFHEVKWLTRCYLLINEQCAFINSMFGVRILLNSLSLLIDMVRFLNVVVRLAVGSQNIPYGSTYLPAVSTFLRFVNCVMILASLVYHCEDAYAQADRIVSVADHILVNKMPDEALKCSLTELRQLVISRPICFNMANFFKLSYPFLVSTISVAVTYTIILLQSV